jgi:hypothetical protein
LIIDTSNLPIDQVVRRIVAQTTQGV